MSGQNIRFESTGNYWLMARCCCYCSWPGRDSMHWEQPRGGAERTPGRNSSKEKSSGWGGVSCRSSVKQSAQKTGVTSRPIDR